MEKKIEQVKKILMQKRYDSTHIPERLATQLAAEITALYQSEPAKQVVCPKPEQIKKKIIDGRIVRCIRYEEFNLHCYSCTLKDICDDPFRTDIPVPSTPASEVVSPCCKCGHSLADHSYSSICEVSGCVCIAFDAVPLNSKEG
jgi:hypothetical protein